MPEVSVRPVTVDDQPGGAVVADVPPRGLRAVHEIVTRHPGSWKVAFQDDKVAAVRFWCRVATEIAGDAWAEECRPIPNRPDRSPDVWISFNAESREAIERRT